MTIKKRNNEEEQVQAIVLSWIKKNEEERMSFSLVGKKISVKIVGETDILGKNGDGITSIEVKIKKRSHFGAICGQALCYSVFADKCYLASPIKIEMGGRRFKIAKKLGIGLIYVNRETKKCKIILEPNHRSPLDEFKEEAIKNLKKKHNG